MKASDVKRLEREIAESLDVVKAADAAYKAAVATHKDMLSRVKANARDLSALNGAIITRRTASKHQAEMKAHWQIIVSRDSKRVTQYFKDCIKPQGYEAALVLVNKIVASDTGFKAQAVTEIMQPFEAFHGELVAMEKLRDGLNEAKKQLERFNSEVFKSKVGETRDLQTQATLLKHKASLEKMLATDAAVVSSTGKALKQAVARHDTLTARMHAMQMAVADSPTIADDYLKQLDNIARARAGQAKKRNDARLAEKARVERKACQVWTKGSTNPLATDVHYKPSGCDYRATSSIATTKTEKAKAPLGVGTKRYI